MTQIELVSEYLTEYSEITPAKLCGHVYRGVMFGSEISRVCRKLREQGKLNSERRGKFEVFYLVNHPSTTSQELIKWRAEQNAKPVQNKLI